MALPTTQDDGFREIQLSGKQLVFLFMAVTVVLVVTFLTGVLVGRGVRAERAEAESAEALTESPETPARAPLPGTVAVEGGDPRQAPPPAPAEDEAAPSGTKAPETEEPPMAVDRNPAPKPAAPAPPAPEPAPAVAAKPAAPAAKPEPPKAEPTRLAPVDSPTAAPAAGSGYAVQVAAVNVRGEADAIVKRLSGKGYKAYVETPKGSTSVFRVRVGTFKTRREAQTIADKLKKEEKFKPWVTR